MTTKKTLIVMALGDHDHKGNTKQQWRWCQEITTTKEAPTITMVLNNHNHEKNNNDNNGAR
jgi:hypothetical protein